MTADGTATRVLKAPRVVVVSPTELRRRSDEDERARRAEVDEAYRAGVAAGRASGVGAVPALVESLDRAGAELARAERERRQGDAEALLTLATELAGWLVGREEAADPSALLGILDRLLEDLPPATSFEVRVPPDVVPVVNERWAPAHGATVVGDAGLAPGEARLVTASGESRLRFEEAFALARLALEGEAR
jgi:flagellar biosynthesis/type III secretory pathway protein FliH